MSIEFRAVKKLGALRAASDHDADLMQAIPEGTPIKLVATVRPRNESYHRWFFGFLGTVAEAKGYNTDQLLLMVKIGTGHVDTVIVPGREEPVYVPRSISFSKMDEQQFREFANRAINFALERIMPGVTRPELVREVYERIGIDIDNIRESGAPVQGGRQNAAGGRDMRNPSPPGANQMGEPR